MMYNVHDVTNELLSACLVLDYNSILKCYILYQPRAQGRGTHLEVIDIAPAARDVERTSAVMVHCTRNFVFHNAVHIGDGLREERMTHRLSCC